MYVFRAFFVGLLIFFTTEFGFADLMYGKVGDSAVLKPDHKIDSITSVTWKHRTDLALEWFGGEITCYRTFDGRCKLDQTTGSFTIRNLTPEDSGEYTPEINNRVLGKKELKVIKPVPKPTVSMDCNKEKTVCNLTCEADITSEFGPVTYEWKAEGKVLSNDNKLSITAKNESSFFCILSNPVSNSASDEFPNPFSGVFNTAGVAIGVVIGVLLLIGVVVLLVLWKTDPRVRTMWPFKYISKKNNSNGKETRNGYQRANLNEDGIDEVTETSVFIEQQQVPPTEQVSDDKGEPGQNSRSEEQEPTDTGPENKSIGKETLNGDQHANMNKDGIGNVPETSVFIEQQQVPPTEQVSDDKGEPGQNSRSEEQEPNATGPENKSIGKETLSGDQHANKNKDGIDEVTETADSVEQQQVPPAQQVGDDKGESGQNSRPEEPEPTADGPENNSNGKETLSGDQHANTNEDGIGNVPETSDSMEQQQDPLAEQVGDDQGESGQNSRPEEQEPNATGPETSPPESPSEETPDTVSSES